MSGPAAVDGQGGARHLRRRLGTQKNHQFADLRRGDELPRGLLLAEQIAPRRFDAYPALAGARADGTLSP